LARRSVPQRTCLRLHHVLRSDDSAHWRVPTVPQSPRSYIGLHRWPRLPSAG